LDPDEARMLARAGFTQVGLPLRLAVHAPDVDDAGARAILAALPPTTSAAIITYQEDPREILALCDSLGLNRVQLHGEPPPQAVARLRAERPGLWMLKSLVVGRGPAADLFAQVLALAPYVDAFITDTFDPASGASGATGKVHDWTVSQALAEFSPRPLILAGGLTPDNVAEAVALVRPAGVDAHTGLEGEGGRKDEGRCRRFAAAAREALAKLAPTP
jgi:phosphoribosylanthranilate isomerase